MATTRTRAPLETRLREANDPNIGIPLEDAEELAEELITASAIPEAARLKGLLSTMKREDILRLAQVLIERAFFENTPDHQLAPLNYQKAGAIPIASFNEIQNDLQTIPPGKSHIYIHIKPSSKKQPKKICVAGAFKDSADNIVLVKAVYEAGNMQGELASVPEAVMLEPLVLTNGTWERSFVGPYSGEAGSGGFDDYFFQDTSTPALLAALNTKSRLWTSKITLANLWGKWDASIDSTRHEQTAKTLAEMERKIRLAYSQATSNFENRLGELRNERALELATRLSQLETDTRDFPAVMRLLALPDVDLDLDMLVRLWAEDRQVSESEVRQVFEKIRSELQSSQVA